MSLFNTTRGKTMEKLKALFVSKPAAAVAVVSAASVPMAANAAITIPTEMLEVFTDLATAFGTLMAAGAVLFGVIRGGVALFKLARTMFSAAGA